MTLKQDFKYNLNKINKWKIDAFESASVPEYFQCTLFWQKYIEKN